MAPKARSQKTDWDSEPPMPLVSLFGSADPSQPWSVPRAACYGAVIGAAAGSLKAMIALHGLGPHGVKVAAAVLGFALLCAGAAALRNFLVRKVI